MPSMMQRHPTVLLAGMTVSDNHPAMDPDPARHRREQIVIAMRAKPPFELARDWDQIFHGDLTRKLDIPIRQCKLPFTRVRLSKREEV